MGWPLEYSDLRNANVLLKAVDKVTGLSGAEKEALRGFAKTIQALDLLTVVNTRDDAGAPVDVDRDLGSDLAPIVTKGEVFTRIGQLLDQAQTHLQNGGSTFPFALTPGYQGFDSPATFRPFNRALRARLDIYTKDYTTALAISPGPS